MSFKNLIFVFLLLFSSSLCAQEVEATRVDTIEQDTIQKLDHSPRKATLMSALLPGLGQVYNKKVWKVPIIYAGIGTCVYFIDRNNQRFQLYKDALVAESDDDPSTVNDTGFSSFQLDQLQDTYRRWRDLSWIILAGVYVLNVIDANVDAHLFYFDVSKNLSLEWSPDIRPSLYGTAGINTGFSLSLNF